MLKISPYFSKLSNLAYTAITLEATSWKGKFSGSPVLDVCLKRTSPSPPHTMGSKKINMFAHHLLGKNSQAVWQIIWRNSAMAMPLVWAIPALHPPPREQLSHCQDSSKAALVHAWRESSCMWKEGSDTDLGLHIFPEIMADVTGTVFEQSCSIQRWWNQI